MLCITNNSVKHQSFVYRLLNDQTVIFQTLRFRISYLFAQFKCQTILFGPWVEPYQVLPLRVRMDLGAMAMKGHSAFPKSPTLLEPHHQIGLCRNQDTMGLFLPLCTDAVGIFYSPSRLPLNSSCTITFTFGLIPLGKVWFPLSPPQLWVKYYRCCFLTRLALTLNNPQSFICH